MNKAALWAIGAGVLVVLIIFGSTIGGNRPKTSATASPAANATTEATAEPAAEEPAAPEPAPAPVATVATEVYSGSGDNVIAVNVGSEPAVVTFDCPACSRNVSLKTNGPDSLLVNTIGAYTGSHVINATTGSLTTQMTITAVGDWSVTIADLTTIPVSSGPVSFVGDAVIRFDVAFSAVNVTYIGDRNFMVKGYGGKYPELAVNTIGSYTGTVELTGPGYVQITSSGSWTVTPV
ncbi:hypothetical protein [Plantibacter flavus]|uniref:hypothetical protein n=1 Tax=Plantibacter flavus TaxID=150123 RepID=UPI0033926E10